MRVRSSMVVIGAELDQLDAQVFSIGQTDLIKMLLECAEEALDAPILLRYP
jgi:hypothetical protein